MQKYGISSFEEDVKLGKLDHLAHQAIADFRAGNFREV